MDVEALTVPGAFAFTPRLFADARGRFCETYAGTAFTEAVGHRLEVAQMNLSVSRRGVVRGVHFADVPPGQAKYVTCPAGAVLDIVVDLREGSPAFGTHHAVRLDDRTHRAVYLPVGVGHAFCALTDEAVVSYAVSAPYDPAREHTVHPLDPALALPWPDPDPVLSQRDSAAPTLAAARLAGLLPKWSH